MSPDTTSTISLSLSLSSMASSSLPKQLLAICLLLLASLPYTKSQLEAASFQLMSTGAAALDWVPAAVEGGEIDLGGGGGGSDRRSLYYYGRRYYISYGALSANRIPCPARSGRSYYNPNCHNYRARANPYTRGCSHITRCRR